MDRLALLILVCFLLDASVEAAWLGGRCTNDGILYDSLDTDSSRFEVYDVKDRRILPIERLHPDFRNNHGKPSYLHVSPNGRYAVYVRNESELDEERRPLHYLYRYALVDQQSFRIITERRNRSLYSQVIFSADSSKVMWTQGDDFRSSTDEILDTRTGKILHQMSGERYPATFASISPDFTRIAYSENDQNNLVQPFAFRIYSINNLKQPEVSIIGESKFHRVIVHTPYAVFLPNNQFIFTRSHYQSLIEPAYSESIQRSVLGTRESGAIEAHLGYFHSFHEIYEGRLFVANQPRGNYVVLIDGLTGTEVGRLPSRSTIYGYTTLCGYSGYVVGDRRQGQMWHLQEAFPSREDRPTKEQLWREFRESTQTRTEAHSNAFVFSKQEGIDAFFRSREDEWTRQSRGQQFDDVRIIDRLLHELGSDSFSTRSRVDTELRAAVDLLPDDSVARIMRARLEVASGSHDLERARRASRILAKLRDRLAYADLSSPIGRQRWAAKYIRLIATNAIER